MIPSTALRTGLLLASKSEARRTMLAQAGVRFELVDSPADEDAEKARLLQEGADAWAVAEGLALAKAAAVSAEGLVLGADQILECANGAMLSKPASPEELVGQLGRLAGTTHTLHSAAVLRRDGETIWRGSESVRMTMRSLSDGFIAAYVEREWQQVRWSVGGYHIEGSGAQLFERIEGSHFAILGLPLLPLLAALRREGMVAS